MNPEVHAETPAGAAADSPAQAGELPENAATSWWSRPSGGREVLKLSIPLVISAMSWTVMTFIDRMLLNWVSDESMNAAFSGGAVWFAIICLPMGVCAYASTFVSQYFGDRQYGKIGPSVGQGLWVAMLVTPIILAIIPFVPAIFQAAAHSAEGIRQETVYLRILLCGAPAMLASQALSAFYNGRGKTSVVMLIDGGAAIANLLLDWVMIFGKFGFPAWGIAGAGWATVIALWLKFFTYLLLISRRENRQAFNSVSGLRFNRKLFGRLIWFGGPSGVQFLLDVLGFTVFVLLVGRLGGPASAATTMAFSISTLAFMPIYGFSIAASILVGQRLAENRPDLATRATWTTCVVALTYMGLMSLLYVLFPSFFLSGFLAETEGAHAAELAQIATRLLWFVAAYSMFDASLMVFSSAIKGAGDTRFVLYVSLVMSITLAAASWLGVEKLGLGVYGCWTIITAWVWVLGIIYLGRFLQGRWKSMRVIEPRVEELLAHPLGGEELEHAADPDNLLAGRDAGERSLAHTSLERQEAALAQPGEDGQTLGTPRGKA